MKFRKITALLLVLCMLLPLSISAFAAEADEHTIYDSAPDEETVVSNEAATSGTIQNSGIRWSLDEKGWLTISGSGEAPVFQSADDQPWSAVRDQITEVWFEGCVNLTTAELPLAPTIGKHAFYNCPKLSTLTMYYGETVLNSIGEDAFWREADSGDTLYIAYIIGYGGLVGPFFVCGLTEDSFCSLPPDQMERFKKKFHKAEILVGFCGNEPVTLKVEPKQKNATPEKQRKPPSQER